MAVSLKKEEAAAPFASGYRGIAAICLMETKRYHTYVIPGNMVDGGRFMGFKTRNVVEGVVCGAIGVGISFAFPVHDFTPKFTLAFLFGLPAFLLGVVGIAGDPLTVFLKNMIAWFNTKSIILYNGSTRFYEESPVDAKMKKPVMKDKLLDMWAEHKQRKNAKEQEQKMVEGLTFEFARDKDEEVLVARRPEDKPEGAPQMSIEESLGLEFAEADFEQFGPELADKDDRDDHFLEVKKIDDEGFLSDPTGKADNPDMPTISATPITTGEEDLF